MISLLSLMAWALLFAYASRHPIRGIPFRLRGGGGGDNNEVELPSYSPPAPKGFDLFGTSGSYDSANNTYRATMSPEDLATFQATKKIRNDLLNSLGLGSTPENDPWANLLLKESLRTTQPSLENALIGRGLGGSTVYKDAITDLFSKLGTQAALGSQNYKLNNLNALQNFIGGQETTGMNLLNTTANNANTQEQMYLQRYLATLPYLAKLNQDQGTDWGGVGGLAGMGVGLGLSALLPGSQVAWLPALASMSGKSIGSAFNN